MGYKVCQFNSIQIQAVKFYLRFFQGKQVRSSITELPPSDEISEQFPGLDVDGPNHAR